MNSTKLGLTENEKSLEKPSVNKSTSIIFFESGFFIEMGRNRTFRASGNTDLPLYSLLRGFIVMNIADVLFRLKDFRLISTC